MHNAIAKMLCLHIPSLHPPTFTELELEVPAVVQIAALLGVGLLYQGSAHRLMTEVMLDEIRGTPPCQPMGPRPASLGTLPAYMDPPLTMTPPPMYTWHR